MNGQAKLPHPRIFYGWFVVAAAFAVTFVGFGSAYTFSAFVESLQRDFGASRGSVSLVFSLAGFLYFGLGIVSGPLADRFGDRRVENDPRGRGLGPDGDPPPSDTNSAEPQGAAVSEAIRSMRFVSLYATCVICSFGVFVPFVHLVPYARDHGIAQSSTVLLLAVIGIGSTAGRFFLGGLADRMGRELSLLLMFVGMALALAIWAVATTVWPLVAFAFVYGVFYGGWVAVLPAVVMDYFGGRNVSGLIGILYTSVAFGTLIGPSAAGFAFDVSHSYTLPILLSAGANIVAAIIVTAASRVATPKTAHQR